MFVPSTARWILNKLARHLVRDVECRRSFNNLCILIVVIAKWTPPPLLHPPDPAVPRVASGVLVSDRLMGKMHLIN